MDALKYKALGLMAWYPTSSTIFALIGLAAVARFAVTACSVLAQTFLLPGTKLEKYGARNGAWAVVTGASDGIGAEFAVQLAEAGFNVLLIARNFDKLCAIASRIEADAIAKGRNVSVKILVIDFLTADKKAFDDLASMCSNLDVGVLVNNVGKSHDMPLYFVDAPKGEIDDIIKTNINGTINVTYSLLPQMIMRKRGLVLNIGSFAGAVPTPMLTTYSATKAFLVTFSAALAEEVRQHNITIELVNAYFVVSKLSKVRQSMMRPLPGPYVRAVLSKIGLPCGAARSGRPGTSTPFWAHALLDYFIHAVGCTSFFISFSHKAQKVSSVRALKRKAKSQ